MFLNSIDEVRKITWRTSYTWEIKFMDGPDEFKDWFPAVDVDEPVYELSSYDFKGGIGAYSIPLSTGELNLTITFMDSDSMSVHKWIKKWVSQTIFNNGIFVSCLSDSVKMILVRKNNKKGEMVRMSSYFVYPFGPMNSLGSNSSSFLTNSINFKVAFGSY